MKLRAEYMSKFVAHHQNVDVSKLTKKGGRMTPKQTNKQTNYGVIFLLHVQSKTQIVTFNEMK